MSTVQITQTDDNKLRLNTATIRYYKHFKKYPKNKDNLSNENFIKLIYKALDENKSI